MNISRRRRPFVHLWLRAMPKFNSDSQISINLRYIADLECFKTEKPYRINDIELEPDDNLELTNIEFEARGAILHDLRNQPEQLDFDKCGFRYIDFAARNAPSFEDESMIAYSNEAIERLHHYVDADKILCYDLRVCTVPPNHLITLISMQLRKHSLVQPKTQARTDRSIPDEPIEAVHIGKSSASGLSEMSPTRCRSYPTWRLVTRGPSSDGWRAGEILSKSMAYQDLQVSCLPLMRYNMHLKLRQHMETFGRSREGHAACHLWSTIGFRKRPHCSWPNRARL